MKDLTDDLKRYFPVWSQLSAEQQNQIAATATKGCFPAGAVLHNGSEDCVGLFIVTDGQLRAYMVSEEGKEITLYRLLAHDICLFSASCMLSDIQFDISVAAEEQTEVLIIPTPVYHNLVNTSLAVSHFTNQLMASRFSDVMWLLDQILFKSLDERLAAFLLAQSNIEASDSLHITHEKIARHLGTAREVVSRMLQYFQGEGLVKLSRGTVEIINPQKLQTISQ